MRLHEKLIEAVYAIDGQDKVQLSAMTFNLKYKIEGAKSGSTVITVPTKDPVSSKQIAYYFATSASVIVGKLLFPMKVTAITSVKVKKVEFDPDHGTLDMWVTFTSNNIQKNVWLGLNNAYSPNSVH